MPRLLLAKVVIAVAIAATVRAQTLNDFDEARGATVPTSMPSTRPQGFWENFDSSVGAYSDQTSPLMTTSISGSSTPKDPMADAIDASMSAPSPATAGPATQPTTVTTQLLKSKGEWLIAPLPTHQPEFGWGITGTVGYIFPLDSSDKVSPPSTIAGVGYYAQNSSWAAGLASKFYFDQDHYRVTAGLFHGQLFYDFYGTGTAAGNSGESIPLSEQMTGRVLEALFRIAPNFYLGPRYLGGAMHISVDTSLANLPVMIPSNELDTTSSGLGLHAQWDTRDSQFYPRKGFLFDADINFHDPAIGDNFRYQVYQISYNQYLSLSARQVLAFRIMGQFEGGNVPFYALSQFGQGADLRGYQRGQYQDKQMFAGQVEYRLEITKHFGAVAFAGVGEVMDALNDLNFDDLLPSIGVGLRFVIAEKNHVAIRLDGAWGRDGGQYYLGVGEAF